ncbi:prolipoprotein diacylglyceryl transferase [Hymenobacter sp. B1770]|uniref:prolipoprotein diacylglyceryl transferase n=1 Tax=Hymenobacter sp. B1770 TaxID=1718788 RepID=UPI003CF69C62
MLPFLAAIYWNVDPIIHAFGPWSVFGTQLGPITLRWYGLFFMLPFVLGTFVLTHIYRSERTSPQWVDVITIYMLIGTIVGARLGHMLFYDLDALLADPMVVFRIWQGGLASHGATIGILLACWLFARNNKFDYLWVLDRIVIVVALGGACIRTGNLMNSEIVGKPTDVPWAFIFPRDIEHLVDGVAVPRHPTQLYEALFCVFLLILLYSMWNRTKERTPRGQLFGLFVVLLFTQRFLGEFLKENQVAFEDGNLFNQGQLLSIPLIIIGIWVLWRAGKDPQNPYGYAPRDLGLEEGAQPSGQVPPQPQAGPVPTYNQPRGQKK